jgi:Icc-related predicted phosphoesterase
MRVQVVSDLHLDVNRRPVSLAHTGADVVVIAGDVHAGVERAFAAVRALFPAPQPVVMVAGNHEYYGRDLVAEQHLARALAPTFAIHWLDLATVTLGGVRFIGATLWTDYDYFGHERRAHSMEAAAKGLNDHRLIGYGPAPGALFTPQHARALHLEARRYIEAQLTVGDPGTTVVVTHHVPHRQSVATRYSALPLTAAFASDLSPLIDTYRPALWVHGHTHVSSDYRTGRTRIVCNPHGYGDENPEFDGAKVIEVGRSR